MLMSKKVKVISLERSIERRNLFKNNNPYLDYEFINGIDGKLLKNDDIYNLSNFINPLPFPSMGAYGAALSHLSLWDRAIEEKAPITIAEDDAIFRYDFHLRSEEIILQLPVDWDIVLWGWNFDSILSLLSMMSFSPAVVLFNQDMIRNNIDKFKLEKTNSYPLRLDKCFGIPAYTISPKGAGLFKSLCFPLKNFELFFPVLNKNIPNTGIDIAMNKVYSTTASFVSFPPLAITKNEHNISTIQNINK